jgi:opacity protein-like surface antigen
MRSHWIQTAFILAGLAAPGAAAAHAQTDVAASLYGAFSESSSGNMVTQSPSNAAGGIIEVRHIDHPWFGYEGTYSYNRANQTYIPLALPVEVPGACPTIGCPSYKPVAVSANAHEIAGDWVASVKVANLRPFALAGVGLLLDVPSSGQTSTQSTTKPLYVYGAGVDWGLLPHLGLRFQYRGNLYHAPDLTKLYTSSSAFTHTAEPMIGIYFRL